MILSPLYHWSPAARYDAILRDGLTPLSDPTVASGPLNYVCASTDPAMGWSISGGMDWMSEVEVWDLWLIWVGERDAVHVRDEWGPVVREVRIRNSVPAERLWWIGRRSTFNLPEDLAAHPITAPPMPLPVKPRRAKRA